MRQATISGNLGKDAEWKAGSTGEFLSFSVATSNGKDKNGNYKPSTWVNCTMPGSEYTTKVQPYLIKGTKVIVQGDINCRAWTGKDGSPESSLQLSVKNLEFIGSKQDNEDSPSKPQHTTPQSNNSPSLESDDIPF